MAEIKKIVDKNNEQIYPETSINAVSNLQESLDSKLSLSGGNMSGPINMGNSANGKISLSKTDGTLIDGIYVTIGDSLRIGDTDIKANIMSSTDPSVVLPDSSHILLHRGNIGRIPYVTTDNLDVLTMAPGDYANIASRFVNLPIPGEGGYIDLSIRENQNANIEDPENPNIRRTIIVHYTYLDRTFIGYVHNTHGLNWIELASTKDIQTIYTTERNDICNKLMSITNQYCKTIGFITDTHYIKDNRTDYGYNGMYHIQNILDTIGNGIGDMIIHGGDAVNGKNLDVIYRELMDINRTMLNSHVPIFFCRGNHDDGTHGLSYLDETNRLYSKFIDKVRWNQLVTSKYLTKYGFKGNSLVPYESTYAYYDFADVKLRVICLDVHDFRKEDMTNEGTEIINIETTQFQISQNQMNWFANEALDLPDSEGWKVIVFSHMSWYSPSDEHTTSRVRNSYQVHGLLKALNEHTSYSADNSSNSYGTTISADFTGTSHKVVANIAGHYHDDFKFVKDNINYIYCKQSACQYSHESFSDQSDLNRYRELGNPDYEDAWTTFTIDTNANKLYVRRFGSGKNFEADLTF